MSCRYLSFCLLPILLLGGHSQCRTQNLPQISGRINLRPGWRPKVYLLQPRGFTGIAASYAAPVIDSARIEPDGSFAFNRLPEPAENVLLELCIQPEGSRFPNQLLDDNPLTANYMPLVLERGVPLEVAADAERLQATFSIANPSAENLALLQLRSIRLQSRAQHGWSGAADESNLLEREEALRQFQMPLMAFADSTAYLWPALVAARWLRPDGDYERTPEFIVGLCRKWLATPPGDPWVDQLCQTANREKLPILLGDTLPGFLLPMLKGDTVLLRTLLGARITVLDLWASWCAPCRKENRDVLAPLWTRYQSRGLQIIGYSLDSAPAAWRAAITRDAAGWPQASHLSGDTSPFLDALRITTIPANFILDARGRVVAKNLHGQALAAFVSERLQ